MADDFIFYYPEGHEAHAEEGHPERPERVEALRGALERAGYWDAYRKLPAVAIAPGVLKAIHTPEYLSRMDISRVRLGRLDGDTYVTPTSWDLALKSAGGALAVSRAIWSGAALSGFALCRPPGHHATPTRAMGFCLLNNVALAAEDLIQTHGAKRVAILDLDLHHGNGTQDIFWHRPDVLFISTHQHPLYPGSGGLNEQGDGPGKGFTANFPLLPGAGDTAFRVTMEELILPLLKRFEPEILLISIGFDAHWADPLGELQLTAQGYEILLGKLRDFAREQCGGKIALVLEGGYDLGAAQACGLAAVSALLQQPFEDPLGAAPSPEGSQWKSMVARAKSLWGF